MLVKGPLSSTIMLFQLMTDSPKGTKPLINVMIYILYKLTLKFKLWYLTAILICGWFCNKEVSKIVFTCNIISIRFIFLNRMKCGLFLCNLVGQTAKIRTMANTLGQSYQDSRSLHGVNLRLPFISLITWIKIQKWMWFILIIIYK